ncbi:MAG: hypothetical protein QW767_05205 [Thermoprotei archaeon]
MSDNLGLHNQYSKKYNSSPTLAQKDLYAGDGGLLTDDAANRFDQGEGYFAGGEIDGRRATRRGSRLRVLNTRRNLRPAYELRQEAERRLVEALTEVGPRSLADVSKLAGLDYTTTVRTYHRMHNQLGLRCIAAANFEALNLAMAYFSLSIAPKFKGAGLESMSRLKTLSRIALDSSDPSNAFGLIYVPSDYRGHEYLKLFQSLKENGIIEDYSYRIYSKRLRYGVIPSCINWVKGTYVFDWQNLKPRPSEETVYEPQESSMDAIDLYLIKELELDAGVSFSDMSRSLRSQRGVELSERLLLYHFREHVIKRKMLSRYKVFLTGSENLRVYVEAEPLTDKVNEYLNLVRSNPLLTVEFLDHMNSSVLSVFDVPGEHYAGLMRNFLPKALRLTLKTSVRVAIPGLRLGYTIPYELFDSKLRRWEFNWEADSVAVTNAAHELVDKEAPKNSSSQ